jgi:hypothetical protein
MSLLEQFFIPREELLRLTARSFEQQQARLELALASEGSKLFEGKPTQILATLPGHLVVLTADGSTYRVVYEETASGEYRFICKEQLASTVYTKADLPKFLRTESKAIATLMLQGSMPEASRRLKALAQCVQAPTSFDEQALFTEFSNTVLTVRPWKTALKAHTSKNGLVFNESASGATPGLKSKFFKLYDGSISGTALEQYRNLVCEDLKYLAGRLREAGTSCRRTIQDLRAIQARVTSAPVATFGSFGAFAEDFISDLERVELVLTETVSGVDRVDLLGKTYDTLAEELCRYELAVDVLQKMTNRLRAAEPASTESILS